MSTVLVLVLVFPNRQLRSYHHPDNDIQHHQLRDDSPLPYHVVMCSTPLSEAAAIRSPFRVEEWCI